jgi:hypothetical protein
MRTALACLILTAGLVTAAQAQGQAQPAPAAAPPAAPATTPPAPPATTPAPAAPAAQAPATTPAPAAQAPAATPAPSAEPTPTPTPEPAAETPTLPTTGDGAVLLSVVDKICVPMVRGGNVDDLAKAMPGMKKDRRSGAWTLPLGGDKAYVVTVFPAGSNKDVCRGEIHYAVNQTDPIVKAINTWSFLHQPEFVLQANYVKVYDDGVKRVQRSWEHLDATGSQAVNFTTLTKPDDTAVNNKYSAAEFYYQERKF